MSENIVNETTPGAAETPPALPAAVAAQPSPGADAGFETWTVPLDQIDAEGSPFRFRRAIKPDPLIRHLAESIEREGLIHPLVVRKVGGAFQLVSGFRRHAALLFLARRDGIAPAALPVKVSVLPEGTSDDHSLHVAFAENLDRKTLDPTDRAIAVLKLREHFGKGVEEIAALVRLKARQIDRLMEVAAAPEDVREAFREGKLSLRHALALSRVNDPLAREAFIRRAGVKRLRVEAIEAAASTAGAEDSSESPSDGLPEKVLPFVRLAETADPELPFRLTVRLKTREAVDRVAKYLVRFA